MDFKIIEESILLNIEKFEMLTNELERVYESTIRLINYDISLKKRQVETCKKLSQISALEDEGYDILAKKLESKYAVDEKKLLDVIENLKSKITVNAVILKYEKLEVREKLENRRNVLNFDIYDSFLKDRVNELEKIVKHDKKYLKKFRSAVEYDEKHSNNLQKFYVKTKVKYINNAKTR